MSMSDNRPPPLAETLLRRAIGCNPEGRSVIGDLREEYLRKVEAHDHATRTWYWREAISIMVFRAWDALARNAEVSRTGYWKRRRGDAIMRQLVADLRFRVKTLRRTPTYTTIAAITLALGIGANTAIFSVVDSVLLNPLPYPDSDEIVGVWHHAPGLGYDQFGISPGVYFQYLEQNDVFESMALFQGAQPGLVRKMVVLQGAKLAIAGVVIGVAAAALLTRFMQSLLFGTEALDPCAFVATSLLLLAVGLLASYIPARRASAVDPVKSLRMD